MPVLGFSITPHYPEEISDESYRLRFNLSIREGQRATQLFFSNRTVRAFLRKNPNFLGLSGGYIEYLVFPKEKTVRLSRYYPLSRFPHRLQESLLKKGIASEIERKVVWYLCKKFPEFNYREALNLVSGRPKQVEKRNMKAGQVMPLREFWQLLQRTTRDWKQEKRLEKRAGPIARIKRFIRKRSRA